MHRALIVPGSFWQLCELHSYFGGNEITVYFGGIYFAYQIRRGSSGSSIPEEGPQEMRDLLAGYSLKVVSGSIIIVCYRPVSVSLVGVE